MAFLINNIIGVACTAQRYDHPERVCGSSIHVTFRQRDDETGYLSLTAPETAELGRALLDLADALNTVPWEQTEHGRRWAETHGTEG